MNARGSDGSTPLHCAVSTGRKKVVEYLILKGADVNVKVKEGWKPRDPQAAGWHKALMERFFLIEALKEYGRGRKWEWEWGWVVPLAAFAALVLVAAGQTVRHWWRRRSGREAAEAAAAAAEQRRAAARAELARILGTANEEIEQGDREGGQ